MPKFRTPALRTASGIVALCGLLLTQILAAQTSDPQALALIAQSAHALNSGTIITDATLTGTVRLTIGSTRDSGTATFKVKGFSQSRMDLTLTQSRRSEVRSQPGSVPQGAWVHPVPPTFISTPHSFGTHNLYTDSAWFFPALTALMAAPASYVARYIGAETHNGVQVQHIRLTRGTSANVQSFSTTDYYLDASSLLPLAMSFTARPDNNARAMAIPIEVRYGNYQVVGGVRTPFSIRKYLNNGLVLDITIQNAVLNSGLTDSEFTLQ